MGGRRYFDVMGAGCFAFEIEHCAVGAGRYGTDSRCCAAVGLRCVSSGSRSVQGRCRVFVPMRECGSAVRDRGHRHDGARGRVRAGCFRFANGTCAPAAKEPGENEVPVEAHAKAVVGGLLGRAEARRTVGRAVPLSYRLLSSRAFMALRCWRQVAECARLPPFYLK